MNERLADYVAGRTQNDHPLAEAAKVALEANQTPRIVKMKVDQDGTPIEITFRSSSQIKGD